MGVRSTGSHPTTTKADGHLLDYFRQTFGAGGGGTNASAPDSGLTATGGVISDYTSGSDVYRAHIFTSSSTFEVTELGNLGNNLEYLVVAGGGGGADDDGGGGGAGGFRTNLTGHPVKAADYAAAVGTYTVTVGAGGVGGTNPDVGGKGNNSEFYPTPVSYPSTQRIRSVGGGCGFKNPMPSDAPGGSGGGSGWNAPETTYGSGNTPSDPNHPQVQGYRGGGNHPSINAGGGGGAGGVGQPGNDSSGYSKGGVGLQCLIAGPPAAPQPIGAAGPGGHSAGWFAGGGGGGGRTAQARYGGGGSSSPFSGAGTGGGPSRTVTSGTQNTGGGGGGFGPSGNGTAGNGGSGVVVVRYKIASVAAAKATGGAVTFYNNKTIHTFTSSGTFATEPNWSSATVDYLVVGGGGAGGSGGPSQFGGGGGGAGAVRIGTTPIGAHPVSTSIQVGAGGASASNDRGGAGTDSYFGTPITAPGGGGGGGKDPANAGGPGGSGGGSKYTGSNVAGGTGSGDDYPGSPPDASPSNGWGNDGGPGSSGGGGGGGGAGSTGSNSPGGYTGGPGGTGIQIPSTFYDPAKSTIGFPGASGVGWIAGGGGGSTYGNPNSGGGGGGGAAAGDPALGYAGAGWGQKNYSPGDPVQPLDHGNAKANSGSGGGGNNNGRISFEGGSGLVLIAYPT